MVTSKGAQGRGPDEESIFLERLEQISKRGAKDERFRILGEIAQGGMGRVLRVYDEDLRRELAMKVIRLGAGPAGSSGAGTGTRENLALFLEEVQITSQLNHQSVVPVHDIGVNARGELYYLMPLLRGIDLRAGIELMLRGAEGWTLPRIVDVICRTAQAVEHAHQRGVVHRDLKPANLMVGDLGEIWVLDWGLAQLQREPLEPTASEIDSETHLLLRTGGMVGTPGYMAPEQVDAEAGPTGPRSDVYALGAILYHVLTGEMAYSKPEPSCAADTIVQRMFAGLPRRVHECAPDAHPELVAICEKAMQRDPAARYASALAMAQDLRAWLEGRVVSTYGVGALGIFRKWRRRNRAAARALDALAGLLLVGSIALTVQEHKRVIAVERAHVEQMRANNAANLRAADLSIQDRDSREAVRLLDLCPPQHRAWEWDRLRAQADTSLAKFSGHKSDVFDVTTDAEGTRALSRGSNGELWLWDLAARRGRHIEGTGGEETPVLVPAVLSPTGRAFATTRQLGRLSIVDIESNAVLHDCGLGQQPILALCWSRDGQWLACGDKAGRVTILVAATGLPAGPPLNGDGDDGLGVFSLSFSRDGTALAVARNIAPVEIWDWRAPEPSKPLKIGSGGAWNASFDATGSRLLVASRDHAARLYDLRSNELRATFEGHADDLRAAIFSRDGERVITASGDKTICVWRVGSTEPEEVLVGHTAGIRALALVASDDEVLSCSTDGTLRLWPLHSRERTTLTLQCPPLAAMALDPECGKLKGVTLDGRVLPLEAGVPFPPADAQARLDVRCAEIDETTQRVLIGVGDGSLVTKRLADGVTEWSRQVFSTPTVAVALDAAGLYFAGAADDGALCVLDRKTGAALLDRKGPGERAWALAFSPREPWLAVAPDSGSLELIEPFEGGRSRSLGLANSKVRALAWTPDGTRLAAGSMDGGIVVIDPQERELPLELVGHATQTFSLRFAPNGLRLYSASADKTMRVWDPRYPAPLLTLNGPDKMLGPLALDLEHSRVAAAVYVRGVDADQPLMIWTALPGP
jgi:WD40 repeat protein